MDKISMINKTLSYSTAESITGGRLQAEFTSKSGSSEYFAGGVTAYSTDIKVKLLDVNEATARLSNSVCDAIAIDMAQGCQKMFDTDVALATTGYVQGFSFEGKDFEPVVIVAVFHKSEFDMKVKRITLPKDGTRESNLELATNLALDFLIEVQKSLGLV